MLLHHHYHHRHNGRNSTRFIELDAGLCKACWKCIDACPIKVLGRIDLLFHRHAVIRNADNCKGCKKCVTACPEGAITYIYTGRRQP